MTIRVLGILAAMCLSTTTFVQDAPPKVGGKPLTQMKPKEPMGCGFPASLNVLRIQPVRACGGLPL
jgi:hypothetical protein